MFEQVDVNGNPLKIPAILPRLESTPGCTTWPGGEVGSHTDEVLATLGYSAAEVDDLRRAGDV